MDQTACVDGCRSPPDAMPCGAVNYNPFTFTCERLPIPLSCSTPVLAAVGVHIKIACKYYYICHVSCFAIVLEGHDYIHSILMYRVSTIIKC